MTSMHSTDAIVLKRMDVGEADILYALYTREYGKMVAVAAGIRKSEAKLRGHLEPLSLSSVRLIAGRRGEKLIGATVMDFWENMRGRETTVRLASYVAHRIDEQCFAGERDPALWDFVYACFAALNQKDFSGGQAERFIQEFDTGFSACLGHGDGDGERTFPFISSDTAVAKEPSTEYYREK